ncbi:MAG: hypothetical protein NC218_03810 [Acetobacter sp.]|nr:hypothetical protein [Acetobacter sp.]
MDYYNFDTPVTQDLTLTAVWNDIVNPNTPTLVNLKKALDMGIAPKTYPVGTKIPHTDLAGKDNSWVIMDYRTMPVAHDDTSVDTYGVILSLEMVEGRARYWSSTTTHANYALKQFQAIDDALPEEERQFFVPISNAIYGAHFIFFPTQQNLTFGNEDVWAYYNSASEFYPRSRLLSVLSSNPTMAPSFNLSYQVAQWTAINYFAYQSNIVAPTTRTISSMSITTSTGTLLHSKYCVFMPKTSDEVQS